MIIAKKTIDTTPDGNIKLFQLPSEYISNSVLVFEVLANSEMRSLQVNELGGVYIETIETPNDESRLIILYDYNDTSIEVTSTYIDGFKPWDSKRLIELSQNIVALQKSVIEISNIIKTRVSKEEIQTIVGPLYDEINAIKNTIYQ